jgi:ATPase subunit of ABC transporter with duplicated ATPase domains
LAIAASRAKGVTKMQGLSELRYKESDRLKSIHENLIASKIDSSIRNDDLIIKGSHEQLIGNNKITTYHDHRIAMSFSILNLICKKPLKIDNLKCIEISYPKFKRDLKSILKMVNIITVDGPAGVGKGTVCKLLAKYLNAKVLNSGEIFRTVAYYLKKNKVDFENTTSVINIARNFEYKKISSNKLYSRDIDLISSKISMIPSLRKITVKIQKDFVKSNNIEQKL